MMTPAQADELDQLREENRQLRALTTIDGAQIPNADEPFDFGRGFTIAREVIHPDIKAGQNVRGRTSDDEPWSYGTATVDGRCLLDRSEP